MYDENGLRILACGGRFYGRPDTIARILSPYPISLLIHGDAGFEGEKLIMGRKQYAIYGADKLAGAWAKANGIPVDPHPADWDRYGSKAGPIRNGTMLAESQPDMVVAFPGNRGTADMIRKAKRAGVPVVKVYDYD